MHSRMCQKSEEDVKEYVRIEQLEEHTVDTLPYLEDVRMDRRSCLICTKCDLMVSERIEARQSRRTRSHSYSKRLSAAPSPQAMQTQRTLCPA